jgi:hypothetical protein
MAYVLAGWHQISPSETKEAKVKGNDVVSCLAESFRPAGHTALYLVHFFSRDLALHIPACVLAYRNEVAYVRAKRCIGRGLLEVVAGHSSLLRGVPYREP